MVDLKNGRDIDLELLTNTKTKSCLNMPKMVHFNKVITQINSLLCDVYAVKSSTGVDNMNDCSV